MDFMKEQHIRNRQAEIWTHDLVWKHIKALKAQSFTGLFFLPNSLIFLDGQISWLNFLTTDQENPFQEN